MYKIANKNNHKKVLKKLLKIKRPYNDIVLMNSEFYAVFDMKVVHIEESLNALAALNVIELIPPSINGVPKIKILQKAYYYLPEQLENSLHFWVPVIISNTISILALTVAILAYIKQ